ncbi:MAG: GC-type dockerin domain-anchored protein [Phycisphaerales bacterium]
MRHTLIAATASVITALPVLAQVAGPHANYLQTLTDTSVYMREDCLGPCACVLPPASGPLTGTFTIVYDHADEWTVYYNVVDVDFHSATSREPVVHFTGTGTYEIGGDFALTQRLMLDLHPVSDTGLPHYVFDSGTQIVHDYTFPAINLVAPTGVVSCTRRTLTIHTTATPLCPADVGSPGGQSGPDGALDNNDFIAFINAFFNADATADFGSAGGVAGPDGQFDNNDFIAFINAFFNGANGCL